MIYGEHLMKSPLILGIAFSVLAANAFAQPLMQSVAQNPVQQGVVKQLMAQDGSERTLNRVAQDGSERTLNRVAQDGSERTLNRVAQDGSERTLNRVVQDGSERTLNRVAQDGADHVMANRV
jgi:hypothetical protein